MKATTVVLFAGAIGLAMSAKTITTVNFEGKGFKGLSFKAHLHAAPCSADGGGHYDGGGTGAVDNINENWPEVTCDSKGKCSGSAWNYWAPAANDLANGLSIVVHNTPNAGEKMLCADLVQDGAGEYSGSFDYLASFDENQGYGKVKKDSATLTTLGIEVAIKFELDGNIADGQTFGAHLHTAPCSAEGGGHYAGGDGVTVDDINENWPSATCKKGKCTGYAISDWQPTEAEFDPNDDDASIGLSVVVHDTTNGNAKMLCADLEYRSPGVYGGDFITLPSYTLNAWGTLISGYAQASKTVTTTMISLKDSDFSGLTLSSHLHAEPCANNGGGHYNGGDGVTVDAVEENWPTLYCDNDGDCLGEAVSDWIVPQEHLDDGLSIVVHNTPNTGEKMLCADISSKEKRGAFKGTKLTFLDSFSGAFYGYPSDPKKSKSSLTISHVDLENFAKNGKKGGKGGKGGKFKGGKQGKLSTMAHTMNHAVSPAIIGASAGLLVVGIAAIVHRKVAKRVPDDSMEYIPLTSVGETTK